MSYKCDRHGWEAQERKQCPYCESERKSSSPPSAGSVPRSDTLIEMGLELTDPAKWAAHQIATKGYGCKTVGEAMNMIEKIVRSAIEMAQNKD